ncbi:MAG: S-adenosylmethionine:tRNA ribosyltransferase-isomerase [Bacteroidota bacterium]
MSRFPQYVPEELKSLRLSDFHYELPSERIAKFPLEKRDDSQLLVYKGGDIRHERFYSLADQLPENGILVFNNTRVVKARMYFQRATGATIEILLLSPTQPHDIQMALQANEEGCWHCVVGNKKRWKENEVLELPLKIEGKAETIRASWVNKADNEVRLSWTGEMAFSQILEHIGNLPLPPYLNREANDKDLHQYQTIYAKQEGAVAAPTAGLHFTQEVLGSLQDKGIRTTEVTLHVGAGTFLPVKEEEVAAHNMHEEQVVLQLDQLKFLLDEKGSVIPVGTTAMRFLESIYFLGVKIIEGKVEDCQQPFHVGSYEPYQAEKSWPSAKEAIQAIINLMEKKGITRWIGETQIYILPSYEFRMCRGIITNFHMPETTLMLLVAALVGEDWKRIYQEAMKNGYRFLSYGDSSLLLPNLPT